MYYILYKSATSEEIYVRTSPAPPTASLGMVTASNLVRNKQRGNFAAFAFQSTVVNAQVCNYKQIFIVNLEVPDP